VEITQLTVVTGESYEVEGSLETIETELVDAARGSFLQLAWLTERKTHAPVGINPASIVSLRALPPQPDAY
jgi:hypothetical protein